jgi:exosortase A
MKIKNETGFLDLKLASQWRLALTALLVLVFWVLFLYWETGVSMVKIWARSDTFAHSFFVVPISFWLIWRQREVLQKMTPKQDFSPWLYVGCITFLWFLGSLASVNSLTQLSLVAILVLTVPAMLGWGVTRVIWFPLVFLFFSVPIGEFLMPLLMEWTAMVTVWALRFTGIPVYREGLHFIISSGHWSVVEACSGIRYLIASMTVGTLFAYLSFTSMWRRIIFVFVSILVPIVANWMRAYLIVLLGHISGNKLAAGVDHLIYGWIFFGVVIFAMFIIGARWSEPALIPTPTEPHVSLATPHNSVSKTWITTFGLVLIVSLPHWALGAYEKPGYQSVMTMVPSQTLGANWAIQFERPSTFKPDFKNPSAEVNSLYFHEDRLVGLYVAYYQHQTPARKLISFSNVLVASQDVHWTQVNTGKHFITAGPTEISLKTAVLQKTLQPGSTGPEHLLVWQLYWIGGVVTTNDYLAKAYAVYRRLTGRDDDSAVIVIYTKDVQTDQAPRILASFLSDNYGAINSHLASLINN